MKTLFKSIAFISLFVVLCLYDVPFQSTHNYQLCEDEYSEYSAPKPFDYTNNLSI